MHVPVLRALLLHVHVSAAAISCPRNPSSSHPPPYPAENCELFCNGSCPFHPEWSPLRPENKTVYRITPFNVTGLVQKDTGDAGGDAGFCALEHCAASEDSHFDISSVDLLSKLGLLRLKCQCLADAGMMLIHLAECKPPYMRWYTTAMHSVGLKIHVYEHNS